VAVSEINTEFKMLDGLLTRLNTFLVEFREYEYQDWIIFRTRTHVFQEFLLHWAEAFQAENNEDFLYSIVRQIDDYQVVV